MVDGGDPSPPTSTHGERAAQESSQGSGPAGTNAAQLSEAADQPDGAAMPVHPPRLAGVFRERLLEGVWLGQVEEWIRRSREFVQVSAS